MNEPSLPALTFGLLCGKRESKDRSDHRCGRVAHQVSADSEPVSATVPIGTLIARRKSTASEDLVGDLLGLRGERGINLTAVDEERRFRHIVVFL